MSTNPYEGSQNNPNIVGTTCSAIITVRHSMTENGWDFYDHSTDYKTYWQYRKPSENGKRYHEITLEEHKKEGVHIQLKMMLNKEEKPTKDRFMNILAPQLKNNVVNFLTKKLCAHCGSEIPSSCETCPNCGQSPEP